MKRASVALAMLALILRVLIPVGFMVGAPAQAKPGTIAIVLCTGQGKITAHMDASGQIVEASSASQNKDLDPEKSPGDCAFAGNTYASLTPDLNAPLHVSAALYHAYVVQAVEELLPGRGLAAPPPPATAPPL